MNRRSFIGRSLQGVMGYLIWSDLALSSLQRPDIMKLTILHTNDVHSRVDPFPEDGSRNAGKGGAARRATLIRSIRQEESNVLLFDSGDIFQGTPYFNFFGGELELKLMSAMGYDAATIGNHDFDAGIDGLKQQLPYANFPFISSNYDVSDTVLQGRIQPYKIFKLGGLKVGVVGVGIELEGLVAAKLYGLTRYQDPIRKVNEWAGILRSQHACDFVICLSHLGYRYQSGRIDDRKLARSSSGVDLILGGHTHTFMVEPEVLSNKDGQPVVMNQVGWAGILLGRLDVYFEHNRKGRCITCENRWIEP